MTTCRRRMGLLGLLAVQQLTVACSETVDRTTNSEDLTRNATVIDNSHRDDINMLIPEEQISQLERQALSGDNDAANMLGNHYFQLGRFGDEIRWRTLSANRGHCLSIVLLKNHPRHQEDEWRHHWNEMLRRHNCTYQNTYNEGPANGASAIPLWDEN